MIYSYNIDRDLVKTVLLCLSLLLLALIFLIPHNVDAITTITVIPQKTNFESNDWIRVDLSINGYLGGAVNWIAQRPDNSTISGSLENLRDGKITHQIIRSAYDNDFGNWSISYTYNEVNQIASFVVDPVIVSMMLDKGLYYNGDIMKINLTTSYYVPISTKAEYYHLNFYDKKGNLVNIGPIDIKVLESHITYDFPTDALVKDNPVGKYKIKVQYYNVFVDVPFEVEDIEKRTTISIKTDKSLYHISDSVYLNVTFSKVKESQALLEITDPSGNTTTTKFPVSYTDIKLHLENAANMEGTYKFHIHYAGVTQQGTFIVKIPKFTTNPDIISELSLDKSSYRPGEIINADIHVTDLIADSASFWFEDPSGRQGSKISVLVVSSNIQIPHKIDKSDMRGVWKMYIDYSGAIKFAVFFVEGEPVDSIDIDSSNLGTPPLLMTLGSGDIKFKSPRGITVDSSDNVYVVDSGNSEIKKFDSNGKFLSSWGMQGNEYGQFKNPIGIFTDKKYVYVADTGNARIQKFDKNEKLVHTWGSFGDGPGMFHTPVSLAADNSGDLFVSDSGMNKILVFDSNGQFKDEIKSLLIASAKFSSSNFITFDSRNNFYIVISNDNRVLQYSSIGTFIKSFGTTGDGSGQFNKPSSIAIDSIGNLYIVDTKNYRIQKFDPNGEFLTSWGSLGIGPGQFKEPVGIAIDSKDNVYVVDKANNNIQKFASYTPDIVIPEWIRKNAKWWAQGVISDSDFVTGIQYMIKQKIIRITKGEPVITDSNVFITSWIKTNVGWWSDKKISDTSFANSIQYLISMGIIKI